MVLTRGTGGYALAPVCISAIFRMTLVNAALVSAAFFKTSTAPSTVPGLGIRFFFEPLTHFSTLTKWEYSAGI